MEIKGRIYSRRAQDHHDTDEEIRESLTETSCHRDACASRSSARRRALRDIVDRASC